MSSTSTASSGTASSTVVSDARFRIDAERALVGVLADEDDGAPEVRVDERRARDQEVPSQRLHGRNHRRMDGVAREIRLVARPQGFPGEDLFEVAETPIPDPADGQVLIRNAYFSVDPYMRPRMNDVRSYVAPFTLGEAMTGGAVGQVVASRNAALRRRRAGCVHQLGLARVGALRRLRPAQHRSVGRARLDRSRRARDARA